MTLDENATGEHMAGTASSVELWRSCNAQFSVYRREGVGNNIPRWEFIVAVVLEPSKCSNVPYQHSVSSFHWEPVADENMNSTGRTSWQFTRHERLGLESVELGRCSCVLICSIVRQESGKNVIINNKGGAACRRYPCSLCAPSLASRLVKMMIWRSPTTTNIKKSILRARRKLLLAVAWQTMVIPQTTETSGCQRVAPYASSLSPP